MRVFRMEKIAFSPISPNVSPVFLKYRWGGFVAVLHNRGSYHVMYERHKELMDLAQKNKLTILGPPYFVYYDDSSEVPEEDLRGDICLPVAEDHINNYALEMHKIEPTLTASISFSGPAMQAPAMWRKIYDWLEKNGWEEAAPPEKHQFLYDENLGEMDDAFEIMVPVRKRKAKS